ncbi:MAG: zinc ribbon domain-containing protein [Caldilineaceae bacterium]
MTASQSAAEQSHEEIELLQRRAELHQLILECQACQEEVEPNWQFCAHCGTRLATSCPGCGNPLPPVGARACLHCGLEIPQIKPSEHV